LYVHTKATTVYHLGFIISRREAGILAGLEASLLSSELTTQR